LDPNLKREKIVAGWIKEAKAKPVDTKTMSAITSACRSVDNENIREALGLPPAHGDASGAKLTN
jgi:hypothetical protein